MLSSISLKKKDEFLLPETIETPMENQKDPGTGVKITSTMTKTKKKKFLKSFLCGASSVLRLVLFGVLYLAPGLLLGFFGGQLYQHQRMAPDLNQNFKLSTKLWEVASMISEMDNIRVLEEKNAWDWLYEMKQGFVECRSRPWLNLRTDLQWVPSSTHSNSFLPRYKKNPNPESRENTEENTETQNNDFD